MAYPAGGDLRLVWAGQILLQPRQLRCREPIDIPKDTPVKAEERLDCAHLMQHEAQGNWGKVKFARWGGRQRGKPPREAETWLHPGPSGQTATKIPFGPKGLSV